MNVTRTARPTDLARPVSKAAFTVKAFAVYPFAIGMVLLVAPNLLLATLGFPATNEVWIRVLGVVVINVGVYYWFAAVSEARPFFVASIYARAFVCVALGALVALGLAKPLLAGFGVVDAAGALWTYWALRSHTADAA